MEGKTMILSVLIMSLVMAQIQVEAKSCCPSTTGRNIYNTCRFGGGSRPTCASLSGCKVISGSSCPSDYPRGSLETSGDAINEYCELGCVSSVCGALTTLQTSDANEIMNRAVGQCTKACSTLCAKGHMNALEIV